MKVEVLFVTTIYEAVGIAHKTIHDLTTTNDQEEDKVIEEFLMRISTNNITVEDNLYVVEKKADVQQESLIEESHIKDV